MKFILGTKLNMSQKFQEDGTVVPMTAIAAGPITVTQVKGERDGYTAIQVGYGKKKHLSKSVMGHLKNLGSFRWLKEFRTNDAVEVGQQIDVTTFNVGDVIEVTGSSKGKGFQGVVKRHGFHGSPKTHGHKDQLRMPGSIGAGEPQHVFKGTRMAGRMGDEQVTVKNLKIVDIDTEKNILYVSGAVPGARNGLIIVAGEGELKTRQPEVMAQPEVETNQEANTDQVETTETQPVADQEVQTEVTPVEATVSEEVKPTEEAQQ